MKDGRPPDVFLEIIDSITGTSTRKQANADAGLMEPDFEGSNSNDNNYNNYKGV